MKKFALSLFLFANTSGTPTNREFNKVQKQLAKKLKKKKITDYASINNTKNVRFLNPRRSSQEPHFRLTPNRALRDSMKRFFRILCANIPILKTVRTMGQRPPNTTQDYIEINKDSWNKRVGEHIKSDFYNHEAFLAGKTSLNEIELALFPDLRGKRVLHLQCHFGQDSISLARLGASVVGVDFSEQAIQNAEHFAKQTQADASFICCNIYDLEDHLEEKFDLIFTSYGTIGWLPDLNAWAKIIRNFLQPDGEFVFVEFHPALWMLDDNQDKIAYSYFNTEAITETNEGTYANKDAEIKLTSITWNHSIGEVFSALSQQGLQIQDLQEYDFSPYNIFFDGEEYEPQRYRIRSLANMLPLVYSLKARIQPGTQTSQPHKKGQA